jgi:hypothetical protein
LDREVEPTTEARAINHLAVKYLSANVHVLPKMAG